MGRWKTAVGTGVILAAAALGAALAPAAHGQTPPAERKQGPRPDERERGPKIVQFSGGGSWIGVSVRDLGDEDIAKAKLPAPGGVMVEEVSSDSPAQTAGVKQGDVIVEYDGERVRGTRQFSRLVQETPAGRKVQASVIRDGQRTPLTIEPREGNGMRLFDGFDRLPDIARAWVAPVPPAPPTPPAAPAPPAPPVPPSFKYFDFDGLIGRAGGGRLGVTVTDLEPQLADYFGAKEGVLVTSVRDNTAAARAGIKAGDVITAINGSAVASSSALRERMSALKDGEEFTIAAVRDKKALTLKGKAEAPPARRRTTAAVV